MKGKRIAILFDDPGTPLRRGPEWEECGDTWAAVRAIEKAIAARGGEGAPVMIVDQDFGFVKELAAMRPDLVLNVCDSFFGETQFEPTLGGILETLGLPFTGTGSRGLALCLDKGLAKALLVGHGIPTPAGLAIPPGKWNGNPPVPLPAIVKPSAEDGSLGIAAESVVDTPEALRRRTEYIWESYHQPALVESYIDGREINVAVWGNGLSVRPLPPSEIDFKGFPEDLPRICTLNAKWDEESPEYRGSVPVCPADVDADLVERLNDIALKTFELFALLDFGRMDFRVDAQGRPFVIDVNPNPDISPDAGFPRSAAAAGFDFPRMIEEIGRIALERHASR